jgi:hypothetical protein
MSAATTVPKTSSTPNEKFHLIIILIIIGSGVFEARKIDKQAVTLKWMDKKLSKRQMNKTCFIS